MFRYLIIFLEELSEKISRFYGAILKRFTVENNDSQNEEQQRIKKLEEIYSNIPRVPCIENCGKCCGLISMSGLEEKRVRRFLEENHLDIQFYNDPLGVTYLKALQGENMCYFLDDHQRCRIYPVRPIICRLYGIAENVRCPYTKPVKFLTEEEAMKLIRKVKKT